MSPAMPPLPAPDRPELEPSEDKLARLGVQVDAMRAVLVRLLQDIVAAESRLESSQAAQLVEANQQLVVAALASQTEAAAATQALQAAVPVTPLDALTQLPNRTTLSDRIVQAIAHARRHGTRFALLFLDLDNFKQLNDRYGHAFGDQVLRQVAGRMLSVVREGDTVSRHGGDEFLVLLDEIKEPDDAKAVADKLNAALGAPSDLDGHPISLTASIGIALYPDDGDNESTLVARADAAMYESKRRGDGGCTFHGAAPAGLPAAPPQRHERKPGTHEADARQQLAQLREANEQLVLAALTAQELQAAAEQARQRQTAFMTAVVDELRNPMAPIRIATAMLGRPPVDDTLLPHVQGIVEQQLSRLSRLVDRLVDAEPVAGAVLSVGHRPLDLAGVIDRAIDTHAPIIKARGQRFALDRPPGALEVEGDAARLEQVVSNLLENASEHTPEGGRVSLSVASAPDSLTLTVTDDGIGISPQMLPAVFEPFVQDTHAIGLSEVSPGIGLTVTRALVRAHGGDLVARSAGIGRGSSFVVTLPRLAGATPPSGVATADP